MGLAPSSQRVHPLRMAGLSLADALVIFLFSDFVLLRVLCSVQ